MNTTAPMRGWVALLGGLALLFPPFTPLSAAGDEVWLDQLTQLVEEHRALAEPHGSAHPYDLYLKHLNKVRQTLSRGEAAETYRMMNQFMAMLEAREGGFLPGRRTPCSTIAGPSRPPCTTMCPGTCRGPDSSEAKGPELQSS